MDKTGLRQAKFLDIKQEIIARIQNGIWAQGALMPTEQELAQEFACARATVNRALRELAEQGLINRKRKSGTRVNATPIKQARFEIALVRQTIEERNATYRYALVECAQTAPPDWLRAQLDLPKHAAMLHLKCMHYADNQPFQFEERWINTDAVPDVIEADFTNSGPNEWLLAQVPFSNAEIAFSAIAADDEMARFLATPADTPLFQMERTTWFQDKPVTFVRMTFHPGYRMQTQY